MPEIVVTDDQLETIDQLREELAAAFVDTYGHIRQQDVIAYLLDTYTPPNEQGADVFVDGADPISTATYPELQQVATEVPDVSGSGIDAAEMRGELVAELGTIELARRLVELDEEKEGPNENSSGSDGSAESMPTETDTSSNGSGSSATNTGGTDPLSGTHRLLDQHSEKWRHADSGEEPYEVDLPDGGVTSARTKDDVKQLLFRHY